MPVRSALDQRQSYHPMFHVTSSNDTSNNSITYKNCHRKHISLSSSRFYTPNYLCSQQSSTRRIEQNFQGHSFRTRIIRCIGGTFHINLRIYSPVNLQLPFTQASSTYSLVECLENRCTNCTSISRMNSTNIIRSNSTLDIKKLGNMKAYYYISILTCLLAGPARGT